MLWDWRAANVGLLLLALAGGYGSMSPDRLARSNVDAIACLAVLFGAVVVSVGGPLYALKAHDPPGLRRPSWRRNPFLIWRDPLQFLALASLMMLADTVGCLIRLPQTAAGGFWTAMTGFSIFLGLVIGQAITYRLFRGRIVSP